MARSDSGSASGLATLFFLVLVGSASFLIMDVQHRAEGYHAIMDGKGLAGTVSVSRCEQHTLGDFCVGRFVSADGRIVKDQVRVNGADRAGVVRGAVLSGSGDVWTSTGRPWLRMTPVQVAAAAPVAFGLMILYGLLNGSRPGFLTRKVPSLAAREKEIRLGRVH